MLCRKTVVLSRLSVSLHCACVLAHIQLVVETTLVGLLCFSVMQILICRYMMLWKNIMFICGTHLHCRVAPKPNHVSECRTNGGTFSTIQTFFYPSLWKISTITLVSISRGLNKVHGKHCITASSRCHHCHCLKSNPACDLSFHPIWMYICVCVYSEWVGELAEAVWPLPEMDPDLVQAQKKPGPAHQHQKVLRSLVSFEFLCVGHTSKEEIQLNSLHCLVNYIFVLAGGSLYFVVKKHNAFG